MSKIKFSVFRSGIVAIILWIVSIFVPITLFVAILFLAITIIAGFHKNQVIQTMGQIESDNTKISWDWKDYLGIILLILVIAALIKGFNPLDIINIVFQIKTP